MNHRSSGSYDRGHDRWRGDSHCGGSSGRDASSMRRPSGSPHDDRLQNYGEPSRRQASQMRDEDWPDRTHDYARGGYSGDYDRSQDERYATGYGEEGNYPGVGNYQDVGGRPGGGYASGEGLEDRDYVRRGGARDYENGGYGQGYESGARRMRDYDESGYSRRLTGSSRGMPNSDERNSLHGAMSASTRSGSYGSTRGEQGCGSGGGYGQDRYGAQGAGDRTRGGHHGRGPKNYTRSDDRIKEDLSERLYEDDLIDASEVTIEVSDGVVKLTGTVEERWLKHRIEDMAEASSGVKDVDNQLRVQSNGHRGGGTSGTGGGTSTSNTTAAGAGAGTSGTGSGLGSGSSGMGARTS